MYESTSLGDLVKRLLDEPAQLQLSLHNELAVARASVQHLIDKYDEVESLDARVVMGESLRAALDSVAKIAERASRIQKDVLLTPATLAVLASQIDETAASLLGPHPILHEEFTTRLRLVMQQNLVSTTQANEGDALRPYDMVEAMDNTIGGPDG